MPSIPHPSAARTSLRVDAYISAATGAVLVITPGSLGDLLGLPVPLLVGAGLFCIGWGILLAWLSRRPTLSTRTIDVVVLLNALWVVDSIALLLTGWVNPTGLGVGFVLLQATAVAAIALWQWRGSRPRPALA